MRITTQGDYALKCILNIAKNGQEKPVSISRMVEEDSLPLDYIQQLLMKLRRRKLIKSIRGATGGYLLNRKPSEISVKDVLEAVEGEAFEVICLRSKNLKKSCNKGSDCVLKSVWHNLKRHIDQYLEKETIGTLLKRSQKNKRRGP